MAKSINFDADIIRFSMGAADTEETFTHDLGRVPLEGFVISRGGNASVLYRGPTAWNSTAVFLRSSLAGTAFTVLLI